MLGRPPSIFWVACWTVISPVLVVVSFPFIGGSRREHPVYTETDTPESRYFGTEITDRKLVYGQESRYQGTEITDHKNVENFLCSN